MGGAREAMGGREADAPAALDVAPSLSTRGRDAGAPTVWESEFIVSSSRPRFRLAAAVGGVAEARWAVAPDDGAALERPKKDRRSPSLGGAMAGGVAAPWVRVGRIFWALDGKCRALGGRARRGRARPGPDWWRRSEGEGQRAEED